MTEERDGSGFDDLFGDEPPIQDDPAEAEPDGPVDWEAKGRAAKVDKMVAFEEQRAREEGLDPTADAERIARKLRALTDTEWKDLQAAAGIGLGLPANRRKVPSKKTQEAVIERFEQRATAAAHLEES